MRHSALANGESVIRLSQPEEGELFELDLELELQLADGSSRRERVRVVERVTTLTRSLASQIVEVTLDPERELLLWRPEYGD